MRRIVWLVAILFGAGTAQATPTAAFQPAQTFALVVGVLSFKDPNLGSFSAAKRKDQAFYDLLRRRGVPQSQMRLLLDQQATLSNIRSALSSLLAQSRPGSSLIIYYAGHGVIRDGGAIYFANYDLDTKRAAQTGLRAGLFAELVGQRFRGKSVWLFADCCYSGALKQVAAQLHKRGFNSVSLTSADSSNISTGNWTFTQTLIDAFSGDPLLDTNRDGRVTLKELAHGVFEAMKYFEFQMFGYARHGVDQALVIAKGRKLAMPLVGHPFKMGQYAFARLRAGMAAVRIVGAVPAGYLCRIYKYNRYVDEVVPREKIKPATFRHYAPGKLVYVRWQRKLWKAKILRRVGDFHRITYPGWPSYWDEWVMSDRIFPGSTAPQLQPDVVAVEWRGRWYPAKVLKKQGNRYLIHYLGYDNTWNEWVGPNRIRFRPNSKRGQ